jgi:DNA-binding MarR family transcriptional regulator
MMDEVSTLDSVSGVESVPGIEASRASLPADEAVSEPIQFHELSQSVCHILRRANLELARKYMQLIGDRHSVRPGVMGILMVTGANPGINQVDIAHQLGLDKANAAELIRSLEATNWIARRRSMQDRRRQGVYLTPLGVQRLGALRRDMRDFERDMFSSFSTEERETLVELLKRIAFKS